MFSEEVSLLGAAKEKFLSGCDRRGNWAPGLHSVRWGVL